MTTQTFKLILDYPRHSNYTLEQKLIPIARNMLTSWLGSSKLMETGDKMA